MSAYKQDVVVVAKISSQFYGNCSYIHNISDDGFEFEVVLMHPSQTKINNFEG